MFRVLFESLHSRMMYRSQFEWPPPQELTLSSQECRWQVQIFNFFWKWKKIKFSLPCIWNQHEKCIQMNTNKFSIGAVALEIVLEIWENIGKFYSIYLLIYLFIYLFIYLYIYIYIYIYIALKLKRWKQHLFFLLLFFFFGRK